MSHEVANPFGALWYASEGKVDSSAGGRRLAEDRLMLPSSPDETIVPLDARGLYRTSPFEHAESAPASTQILTYGEAVVVSVGIAPTPRSTAAQSSPEWFVAPGTTTR